MTVGAVEFKPWALELALRDLAVAGAPAAAGAPQAAPQLQVKRITVNAGFMSLLRLAPVVEALSIDDPLLSITDLGQGRYDFDGVLARFQSPADSPPVKAPTFALYNVILQGGRVDFSGLTVGKRHALTDLSLSLPFLNSLKSQIEINTALHLAFKLNGTPFDTAAEGAPFAQTRKTDESLKLNGFDLAPYYRIYRTCRSACRAKWRTACLIWTPRLRLSRHRTQSSGSAASLQPIKSYLMMQALQALQALQAPQAAVTQPPRMSWWRLTSFALNCRTFAPLSASSSFLRLSWSRLAECRARQGRQAQSAAASYRQILCCSDHFQRRHQRKRQCQCYAFNSN